MYSTIANSSSHSANAYFFKTNSNDMKITDMTSEKVKATDDQPIDQDLDEDFEINSRVKWCLDNKEAILTLHSSVEHTKVFEMYCDGCERYFKHCMFSKKERKGWSHSILCRWCQADMGIGTDPQQFSIDLHIHCNRGGKKECGSFPYHSLKTPPNRRPAKEASIDDITPNAEQISIKTKMSQKECKALARKHREEMDI